MANNLIQIKRSTGNAAPAALNPGELAYSFNSQKLFIGNSSNLPIEIGGQTYVGVVNATPGALTASKAVVVDASKFINEFYIGNSTINVAITTNSTMSQIKMASNSTSNVAIVVPTPAQITGGNYYLNANGQWATVTGATANPAGSDTQVQFNDGGTTMGASAGFTFNKTSNNVTVANTLIAAIGSFSTSANVGSNVNISTSTVFVGNATANAVLNQSTLTMANATTSSVVGTGNVRTGNSTFYVNLGFAATPASIVANATATSQMTPGGANIGANAFLSTTTLFVGNSTANLNITSGSGVFANSTNTATLNPTSLTIGTTVVNTTFVSTAGVVNGATLQVATSFTANSTLVNAVALTVQNQVNTATFFAATSANVGANVQLTTGILQIGNTTVNTQHSSSQITFSNATSGTMFARPDLIHVGNTTANSTASGTQVVVANSTGSTTITPTSISSRDMTLTGNLTVSGTTTIINSTTVAVNDNMIKLANNNQTANATDFGIYGVYGNSTWTGYSGITRTAADEKWRFWTANTTEPGVTASTGLLATLVANSIELANPLVTSNGGTGLSSFTNKGVLYASSTSALSFLTGTEGQVLQVDATGAPTFGILDGGTF